jgi:hypothetical protein
MVGGIALGGFGLVTYSIWDRRRNNQRLEQIMASQEQIMASQEIRDERQRLEQQKRDAEMEKKFESMLNTALDNFRKGK